MLAEAGLVIPDEQEDEVEKFREFLDQHLARGLPRRAADRRAVAGHGPGAPTACGVDDRAAAALTHCGSAHSRRTGVATRRRRASDCGTGSRGWWGGQRRRARRRMHRARRTAVRARGSGQGSCSGPVARGRVRRVPDQLVGYRGPPPARSPGSPTASSTTGRAPACRALVRGATGSGSQRLYSFKDILVLKVVKRLLDTGVSLQNIRVAVEHLRRRGVDDLAGVTLFSDGTTVYECTLAGGGRRPAAGRPGRLRHRRQRGDEGDRAARSPSFPVERADGGSWTSAGGRAVPPRSARARASRRSTPSRHQPDAARAGLGRG